MRPLLSQTLRRQKSGAPECCQAACSLDSKLNVMQRGMCPDCLFSQMRNFPGFKCSRPHLVFMCIKCEWTLYILKLHMLCKKLDVQFWSYFLWKKYIKWNPLFYFVKKKIHNLMPGLMCFSGSTVVKNTKQMHQKKNQTLFALENKSFYSLEQRSSLWCLYVK